MLVWFERYVGLYRVVLDEDCEYMCFGGMLVVDVIGFFDELCGDVEVFFVFNVVWFMCVLVVGV